MSGPPLHAPSTSSGSYPHRTLYVPGLPRSNRRPEPPNSRWPKSGSLLIENANADMVPKNDFNATLRSNPYDVGAYETGGLSNNPEWKIAPGFKEVAGNDTTPPAAPKNFRVQ